MNSLPRNDSQTNVQGKVQFITAQRLIVFHFEIDLAFGHGGGPISIDTLAEVALEGDDFEVAEDPDFDCGVHGFGVTIDNELDWY